MAAGKVSPGDGDHAGSKDVACPPCRLAVSPAVMKLNEGTCSADIVLEKGDHWWPEEKESNKGKGLKVIDRAQETQCWLSQSITPSLSGQNPLTGFISGPHHWPDRGLSPCVITLKGKVTFFCRLMGFFNNGKIWEQQKRPAFSFFNGAAPHCCQRASKTRRSVLSLFILYGSSFRTRWQGRRGEVIAKCSFSKSKYLNSVRN